MVLRLNVLVGLWSRIMRAQRPGGYVGTYRACSVTVLATA